MAENVYTNGLLFLNICRPKKYRSFKITTIRQAAPSWYDSYNRWRKWRGRSENAWARFYSSDEWILNSKPVRFWYCRYITRITDTLTYLGICRGVQIVFRTRSRGALPKPHPHERQLPFLMNKNIVIINIYVFFVTLYFCYTYYTVPIFFFSIV